MRYVYNEPTHELYVAMTTEFMGLVVALLIIAGLAWFVWQYEKGSVDAHLWRMERRLQRTVLVGKMAMSLAARTMK